MSLAGARGPRLAETSLLLLLIVLAAAAALAWRFAALSDTEPRADHAYFSLWLRDVRQAPHLLPPVEANQGFSEALMRDRSSAVNQLLRRIYNQPFRLFNLGTFASYYAAAHAMGNEFRDLVRISIVASIAIALLLAAIARSLGALDPAAGRRTAGFTAALAAALALSCFYLHLFSAQGWHNVALAWVLAHLLASLWVAGPLLRGQDPSRAAWALGLLTLAPLLYSYYVLPWIVIPAIFAQLAVAWPRSRRAILIYTGACVGLLAPAAAVLLRLAPQAAYNLSQSQFTAFSLPDRAWGWFAQSAAVLSAPGLVAALLGAGMLAQRGVVFPLVFLFGHFALWVTSNAVGTVAWHRSIFYLLPILLLGLATFTVSALAAALAAGARGRKLAWLAAGLVGVGAYAIRQGEALATPDGACRFVPSYCAYYLGGPDLRGLVDEIDAELPPGVSLVIGNNGVLDIYRLLSHRRDVVLLPPLDLLRPLHEQGLLHEYAEERNLHALRQDVLWLLTGQGDEKELRALRTLFGPEALGFFDAVGESEPVRVWSTAAEGFGDVTLARVREASEAP